jgi:hypothetical protein
MKLFKKIRKWFNKNFLSKYLITYHPAFLSLVEEIEIKLNDDRRDRKAKEIMKIINSSHYKRFFYRAVNYNPAIPELPETPLSLGDRFKIFVSKIHIFLFRRDIYKKLQLFKRISEEFIEREKKIDEYMKQTTVGERIERAIELGIISKETQELIFAREE